MGDWSEERAREWLKAEFTVSRGMDAMDQNQRLAALLREVRISGEARVAAEQAGEYARGREDTLAEVRRVVEEVQAKARKDWGGGGDRWAEVKLYTDEILSLLDNLTPSKSKDNL